MNAFEALLNLPDEEKKLRGVEHTPKEIAQQPRTWAKAAELLKKRAPEIQEFMKASGLAGRKEATLVLTGAGSSEFVGNAVQPVLRSRLKREVLSVPTTQLVTHPAHVFLPKKDYVVLSFARSGNSPESMATYELVKQVCPQAKQIAITCNKEGKLAKATRADKNALYLQLPEETNDQSLVMTSSYSTMAFTACGLCLLDEPDQLSQLASKLGAAGQRLIKEYADELKKFATLKFTRACFLGSHALFGTMQECHLKLQEMTEGRVAAMFNSFIGLRHGPQVFANQECVIIAALASDARVRQYEVDLLKELKAKKQGCATLVVCDKATPEIRQLCTHLVELFPKGDAVEDDFRVMTDVMVGQILGTYKSIDVGLKPDNPSISGMINRVVQGVTIYPYE